MIKQEKKRKSRFLLKFMGFLIALGLIGVAFIGVTAISVYPKLPSMDELHNYHPKLPLQIYSEDNVILGQFGDERRIFVTFDQTPKMLVNAILAAEDSRFYEHGGIDIRGIFRAIIGDISSRKLQSGASTITMQVARNFFLSSQKTFSRKFYEMLLSYKIEQSLTKNQILELYINQIYLGQRAYGFAEASLTYFGKPLNNLSIAQYATLAGLPKAPSAYNPIANKKRSEDRKIYVLGRMLDAGFINQQQYDEAKNQNIKITRGTISDSTDAGSYVAEMIRQMMYAKYGDSIYSKGYKVYTTINSKMQQAAYSSLRNGLIRFNMSRGYQGAEGHVDLPNDASLSDTSSNNYSLNDALNSAFDDLTDYGDLRAAIVINATPTEITARTRDGQNITLSGADLTPIKKYLISGGNKQVNRGAIVRLRQVNNKWSIIQLPDVEGAIIALNPNNGAIKSLVGGFDFTRNHYNHVTQAMRQPGSGFKPFIYSAALEHGFSANTIIQDTPICFASGGNDGNGRWCPKNDDSDHGFMGPVTFREALARSLNVPTVKILNSITAQTGIDHISHFGFDKKQFQPYLTLSLGANEVTPLQLAEAYAVFANGGYLVNPYIISSITDDSGNVLAKTAVVDIKNESTVIDPRNAYIINSILQDSVRYGTGAAVYRALKRNDLAGKTGTTSDNKDVWFNGYTPNLVAITWVGYDLPKTLGSRAYGASVSLPIWIDFMRSALPQIPEIQLPMPSGIAVLQNVTWKGNDEYLYMNASYIPQLPDNQANEESATDADLTNTDATDQSGNNETQNTESKTNDSALDNLIKNLF
jgi:penicillin-binding protein 1A